MDAFDEAMENDLSAPQALSQFHMLLKCDMPAADKLAAIYHMDTILGLRLDEVEPHKEERIGSDEDWKLVEERAAAKKARDFARADEIRQILMERGFIVKDTPQGAILEKKM